MEREGAKKKKKEETLEIYFVSLVVFFGGEKGKIKRNWKIISHC